VTQIISLKYGLKATVDDADADLAKMTWNVKRRDDGRPYAERMCRIGPREEGKAKTTALHRAVLERSLGRTLSPNEWATFADNNCLNCRRANLGVTTDRYRMEGGGARSNSKSGFRGVYFDKNPLHKHKPYRARIKVHGKEMKLGYWKTAEEAFAAYKTAHRIFYGAKSPYTEEG
jgi:hypothetical protein